MTLHRRTFLARSSASAAMLATAGGPTQARAADEPRAPRKRGNRIVVSTYSFWQFRNARYRDIELCIDSAAEMGFDGFEILHRQMQNEANEYLQRLKRRAFIHGLHLCGFSTHQGFLSPDPAVRALRSDSDCHGRVVNTILGGGEVAVHVNGNVRFVPTGVTGRIVVSAAELDGEIELDMTVSRTSAVATDAKNGALFASDSVHLLRGISLDKPVSCKLKSNDKAQGTIRVTATVAEVPVEKTIESAEKDFRVAEFYRRSGKIDSALFYYQVICRRYPDTLYATQAKNGSQR